MIAADTKEIAKYQPYPEYKDSGVEWLADIPTHWDVSRIKYAAQLNPPKSEVRGLDEGTLVSFIPMEAIGERGELDASRTRPLGDVLTGYSYITDGDVMLAKITPCFENGKGAVVSGLENGIGFATTEVIPARPYRAEDAQFLYYLFTSNPFKALAEGSMYGAGGQKRVADSFVAEYHFAKAPAGERDTIAAFLDDETARIDRLIAKQQQLIELLKEKRQAVISHAVTKGLNPDAPMKDSGVEWLGQVPKHWGKVTFKYLVSKTIDNRGRTPPVFDTGIPMLEAKQIDGETLFSSDDFYKFIDKDGHANFIRDDVKENDILFITVGTIGKTCLVPPSPEYVIAQNIVAFRCVPDEVCPVFILFWLRSISAKGAMLSTNKDSILDSIKLSDFVQSRLFVPPVEEQLCIAQQLKLTLTRMDSVSDKAQQAIQLMQERRTALISAAVTGKIDLRGWTAPADEVAA